MKRGKKKKKIRRRSGGATRKARMEASWLDEGFFRVDVGGCEND